MQTSFNILIASYLEPEYVEQIRSVDERLTVFYRPDLLPAPRYVADHNGAEREYTPAEETEWRSLLAQADILFDFDYLRRDDLPELAPNLRWLQATSAGIGQFVKRMGYDRRMPNTIFTTASGVHAAPLAEHCMMAMLLHYRGLFHILDEQRQQHWERYATTDLVGRTLAVIGLGRIGREVARLAKAFGMNVIGTRSRHGNEGVDRTYPPEQLHEMLGQADTVVVIVPHTPQTDKMIGAAEFAAMKRGAYFINIARGAVVDEDALITALRCGQLGGAALDVFVQEPLPGDSPLWNLPNVLITPHSASTSDRENQRITDLFCDNLRRFLAGQPLHNVLNIERFY